MKVEFTVTIEFSDEVVAETKQIAFEDVPSFLERKIDRALEGDYFDNVEVVMNGRVD
jgi:F0F1-type ATP synthase membrane subunit b/b'